MSPEEAKVVLVRLVGWWPTPELTPPEVLAWTDELTNPRLAITGEEALSELTAMSRSGEPFRPRIGQLVAAVRAARRRKGPLALAPVADEALPLSDPANWAAFVTGSRAEAARLGRPVPSFPDEVLPGASIGQILGEMFRPPKPVGRARTRAADAPTPPPVDAQEVPW